jgi:probable rRNA maturation factor
VSRNIAIVIEDAKWRSAPGLTAIIRAAAARAIARGTNVRSARPLTILLTSDAKLKSLNSAFRKKRKATNVLSFPASDPKEYLGDIAIAHGVTRREARAAGKTLKAHAAHLAVHGVLHLLGYDHESEGDAQRMEPLETRILGELGIADPYLPRKRAA